MDASGSLEEGFLATLEEHGVELSFGGKSFNALMKANPSLSTFDDSMDEGSDEEFIVDALRSAFSTAPVEGDYFEKTGSSDGYRIIRPEPDVPGAPVMTFIVQKFATA